MNDTTPSIESLIIRYLEGECTAEELSGLTEWLDGSPENRSLFRELKAVYDASRSVVFTEDETEARWLKLMSAAGRDRPDSLSGPKTKKPHLFRQVLKYTGIVLLAGVLGFGLQRYLPLPEEFSWNEVFIEAGNKSTLTLSDGTKVTLSASTTLKYPSGFGNGREVWLDGEAFFEVVSDPEHPFVVRSRQQAVTVHGTSFQVQAYDRDPYHTVTLLSGSVSLEIFDPQGNRIGLQPIRPYEQYRFDLEKGLLSLRTLDDVDKYRSWTDGIYRFRDEKLEVVVGRLERYYGVRIRIADERIGSILYNGSFPLDQPIAEVLDLLNYENKFTVKTDGRNFVLDQK